MVILMSLLIIITLIGCNNKIGNIKENKELIYENKYTETEIKLPEDIDFIYDVEINDSNIKLSYSDNSEKDGGIYVSNDYGVNWSLDMTFSEKIDTSNVDYIFNTLGPSGEVVLGTSIEEEYKFYFIDDTGEVSNLTKHEDIFKIFYSYFFFNWLHFILFFWLISFKLS